MNNAWWRGGPGAYGMLASMVARTVSKVLVGVLLAVMVVVPADSAHALCAADPDALSIQEMIEQHTTGQRRYDTLLLGYVVAIKDLAPGDGGQQLAQLVAFGGTVGHAGIYARIRFYQPPSGVYLEDNLAYRKYSSYAVVAHRNSNGTWEDDAPCGQSRQISRGELNELIRLNDACTITGTNQADTLIGTPTRDVICGAGGTDSIRGLGGDDLVRGGPGPDVIAGGRGRDKLYGYGDDDRLVGGLGRDSVDGNAGDDVVEAGPQRDSVYGGIGEDQLAGGPQGDCMASYEASGVRSPDMVNGNRGGDYLWTDPQDTYTSTRAGRETEPCFKGIPGIPVA